MPLESKKRSLTKTITWKIVATLITFLTLYYFTGNLSVSSAITVVEAVLGMILFYIHERVWNRVSWGKSL
jgi:uncharacterized membrane protein